MSKYGIYAKRSGFSVCGAAEAWCKDIDGEIIVLDSYEQACAVVESYKQGIASPHVQYFPKELEPEHLKEILRRQEQTSGIEMRGPC